MSLSEKKFMGLKPVAISQEDTKLLNEVMNSKLGTMQKIRKITGGLYCAICGGIPTQIATFDCGGATQIERYCTPCVEKQFSKSESTDK
jgi:hypothetical protein